MSPDIEVIGVGVVHLLRNEARGDFGDLFKVADFIFAQLVSDTYPCHFVRTNLLKEQWGQKVIVWPNLFFRGYNPELAYLRRADRLPLRGPLGDYHNLTFVDCWKQGLGLDDALQRHHDEAFNQQRFHSVLNDSLAELKKREQACDVTVASDIEHKFGQGRLFFTFNHPTRELLALVAGRLLARANIARFQHDPDSLSEPLGQIAPPVNPWVAGLIGLKGAPIWKGLHVSGDIASDVATGRPREYSGPEIVDLFFRIYSANREVVADFPIHQHQPAPLAQ